MSLVISDIGGFGPCVPSATGGMPSELPVDLSVLYNTMAVIALSVTRLFNRLSSPSTPLYSDPHGLRKLVRSSSSTGHDTKTGSSSDSLTGAWRKMLLLDGVEVEHPPHSTFPALQSSTAAISQRACKLVSQTGKATSGKSTLLCLHMDGISCTDTDSLPTSPLHSPARGRSCSPRPRPSLTWVTLPCLEPLHAAMDEDSSTSPQPHLIGFKDCFPHNHSKLPKTSPCVHTAAVGPGPASNTPQPSDFALVCADSVCLVKATSLNVPATIDSTALPASVLSEVRSMLRAMGAYPSKGIVLPSSSNAHQCSSIPTAVICGSMSSAPVLPLYNASLSSQLGSGTAVGRGGFGSVFSSVWEGEDVAIKRVPFNATSAQRTVQQGPQPMITSACNSTKVPSSWRLPNGILLECAHAIVLGGGCSSVCFEGIVQLRCWSISPLPPSPDHDANTHELLLAMPLLRHSLDQALQQHLPLKDALAAAIDVASAASSLHRHNVVHGDLKCANAMQASDGSWLLVDFGLAATLKGNMRSAAARGSSQGHAAPELLRDGRITTATDVFAAGVMLHRVLTHKSVMRGAPAWWTIAVTAAGPTANINDTLGNGEVQFLTGAYTGGVSTTARGQLCAMVYLLQQLRQAQSECPSARPTMQQLLDAIQGAADCVETLLTRSHAPGFGLYGPDYSSSEEDKQIADGCREGVAQGTDGCSSSPTFSTITTDPAWSSSTASDSEADDADAEQGTVLMEMLSSSETAKSSGG